MAPTSCSSAATRERLTQIGDDLKVRGAHQVSIIVADLNDLPDHEKLVEEAAEKFGGLDAVLLAHGTLGDQPKSESDVNEILQQMNTNALSWMSLLTILGNYFEQRRSGCICVISSVAGERGRGSNYVYGSAKAAVTSLQQRPAQPPREVRRQRRHGQARLRRHADDGAREEGPA